MFILGRPVPTELRICNKRSGETRAGLLCLTVGEYGGRDRVRTYDPLIANKVGVKD